MHCYKSEDPRSLFFSIIVGLFYRIKVLSYVIIQVSINCLFQFVFLWWIEMETLLFDDQELRFWEILIWIIDHDLEWWKLLFASDAGLAHTLLPLTENAGRQPWAYLLPIPDLAVCRDHVCDYDLFHHDHQIRRVLVLKMNYLKTWF